MGLYSRPSRLVLQAVVPPTPPPVSVHIWAMEYGFNQVVKVDGVTNTVIGRYATGAQAGPWNDSCVYDGANIWTANRSGQSMTKLKESDGSLLDTISVAGEYPMQPCTDGTCVYVPGGDPGTGGDLKRVTIATGAVIGVTTGPGPYQAAYDGAGYVWVTNSWGDTFQKFRCSDLAVIQNVSLPGSAYGVAFDGTNMWVCHVSNNIYKIRVSDGAIVGTYPMGIRPNCICFDGTNMWAVFSNNALVGKIAPDGTVLASYGTAGAPFGICYDFNGYVWVALPTSLMKIDIATGASVSVVVNAVAGICCNHKLLGVP